MALSAMELRHAARFVHGGVLLGVSMDIAVVGCGIGGLAAAALLARDGHRVRAFDRARPLGPVGAGLLIQPSGAAVLARLGVLEQLRSLATPVKRLLGQTRTSRTVLHLEYADLHPRAIGLGTHRGALFSVLAALLPDAKVELVEGVEVAGVSVDARSLVDASGGTVGPFDLIIVADGARSRLRRIVAPRARERPYRWGAAWCVVEDRARPHADALYQVYRGTRTMFGLLPTGRAAPGGPPTAAIFWSMRMDRFDRWKASGIERWRAEALALMPHAAPLLDQVNTLDQFIPAMYMDARAHPCHRGVAVLLGDAAHAMSPQLGQGANLALADAAALADAVRETPVIEHALAAFEHRRRGTWDAYARLTRWLTPVFQSDASLLAPLRDLMLPVACRFSPTRAQMLGSLSGMKTGLLSAAPIPPESL